MKGDKRLAGVGGIAFAVCLVAAFTLYGPKGGHYSADEIAAFVAQNSTSFIVSVGLLGVSIVGLIVLMGYMSETCVGEGRYGRLVWGTSVAAGASFLIGWACTSPRRPQRGPAVRPLILRSARRSSAPAFWSCSA